jgi:hypothetical protein
MPVYNSCICSHTGFIRGILRRVRYAKSLGVLFLHRRSPSWTTLVLYSRAVFIFNEPTISLPTTQSLPPPCYTLYESRRLIRSSRPTEIFQPPQQGFFSVHAQLQLLGNIFQLFTPHPTSPQLTSHLTTLTLWFYI